MIDLLQGGQGVFGIALGGVWREIEGSLADLPSERTGARPTEPHPGDELAAVVPPAGLTRELTEPARARLGVRLLW